MIFKMIASVILYIALACFALIPKSNPEHLELSANCPPGFMLNDNNECVSRNLYMQYNSLHEKGVGGLKTSLPQGRDGFSPQQIDLGRYLFFDPVLSQNGKISCATCHIPELGFSDGLPRSIGIKEKPVKRGAPSLWNVAYLQTFFWDARAKSLEEQMTGPLYAEEEMGNTPDNLLKTLNEIPEYTHLFSQAFSGRNEKKEISLDEIYTALAAFESSLISLNSRYDRYAHGFHEALDQKEIEGLNVFRSFVARCTECHTPPLFTNQQIAVLGTPEPDGMPLDPGAQIPFNDSTLRGGFKIPSLRNIELTAPYMHSGRFETLRDVVQFYTDGRGHAVPEGENLILHWHITEPDLSNNELDRLVDFLKTLTDVSFTPKKPEILPSEI